MNIIETNPAPTARHIAVADLAATELGLRMNKAGTELRALHAQARDDENRARLDEKTGALVIAAGIWFGIWDETNPTRDNITDLETFRNEVRTLRDTATTAGKREGFNLALDYANVRV